MSNQTLYLGPPGTGKTTKLLSLVESHLQNETPPNAIAYVSFTRKAAHEAVTRACEKFNFERKQLAYFRTLHSLAFQELRLDKSDVMSTSHYQQIGKMLGISFSIKNFSIEEGIPIGSQIGDKLMQIDNLARVRCIDVEAQWRQSGFDNITYHQALQFSSTLKQFKIDLGLIDFTGMLEACLQVAPLALDVVIIDEAQDLSRLQWKFVETIFNGVSIRYVAGDDDQCQPGDTLVETTKGKKLLSALNPKTDKLLSYAKNDSLVYGKRNGGYKFKKAARNYTDKLFSFSAGGKTVQATLNHRWLVKWVPKVKKTLIRVVYIMRRGNRFRVGHCQLFRADGILHAWGRTHNEKADALWILKAFDNSQESYAYEQITSVNYGIPQIPFEPAYGSINITKETINNVYENCQQPRIAECLAEHNRSILYPFRTRHQVNTKGAVLMELQSCNIMPGLMMLPIYANVNKVSWAPVDDIKITNKKVKVYSLDVEKYHTYIANDVVTCNSIYKWSGADIETFLNIKGDREVLNHSYRLPQKIFDIAEKITGRIKHRYVKKWTPRAEQGVTEWIHSIKQLTFTGEGSWLLLGRNNYMLNQFEELVKQRGFMYTIKGRAGISASHKDAIIGWEALRKGIPISLVTVKLVYKSMLTGHVKRGFKGLKNADSEKKYTMEDLKNHHGLQVDGPWFESLNAIALISREYYRECLRNGERLNNPPRININTIHGVKGGEADNVVLLTDMAYLTYKNYLEEPDDEHRVFYVGVTRAKERLMLVTPQTNLFYEI